MSESVNRRNGGTTAAWISAGLVLAVVPVLANLFAFVYEAAYCRVFGIPTSFISLTPTTVFVVAGALVIVLCLVFWVADVAIGVLREVPHGPIRRGLAVLTPFLLLFAAYLYLYRDMWREWIWVAALVAAAAFVEFVFPLIFQSRGSYREKFDAEWEDRRRARPLTDWFGARLGSAGLLFMIAVTFGLLIAYGAGRAEALRQEDFLVLKGETEAVVLQHYGDTFILAPFGRATKQVERSFFFVKEGDSSRPVFSLEDVGPLRSDR